MGGGKWEMVIKGIKKEVTMKVDGDDDGVEGNVAKLSRGDDHCR